MIWHSGVKLFSRGLDNTVISNHQPQWLEHTIMVYVRSISSLFPRLSLNMLWFLISIGIYSSFKAHFSCFFDLWIIGLHFNQKKYSMWNGLLLKNAVYVNIGQVWNLIIKFRWFHNNRNRKFAYFIMGRQFPYESEIN